MTSSIQPTKEQLAPRIHLGYLDSLRALAALYVVIHHAGLQIDPTGKLMSRVFAFGHYAVDLFIVLSGFCLMLPVIQRKKLKEGIFHFLKRRARRILPPYYLALALSLLIGFLFPLLLKHNPITLRGLYSHLFLLQDAFVDTVLQINGALWSISVEWRIYLFFPLLLCGWRRFGAVKTTFAAILLSYFILYALHNYTPLMADPSVGYGIMPQYLGLFSLGMLGASISFAEEDAMLALRKYFPWKAAMFVLIVIVALLSRMPLWHGNHIPIAITDLFVGGWVVVLLVLISCNNQSALRNLLACRPLAFLGTFAYSIYLIHAPLLEIIYHYVLPPLHLSVMATWTVQCLIGIPAILVACYGFYLLCERPFLNRYGSRPPARKLLKPE